MRTYLALTALVSVWCTGLAQQPPCSVPVNVVIPDMASLPKADADAMVARWNRFVRLMKWQLPRWEWAREWHASGAFERGWAQRILLPAETGVPQLSADAFFAHDKKHSVAIQAVTADRGARRVLFVIENGKRMPAAARLIEAAIVSDIVAQARPEDSFGLLTAGGPRVELRFSASREAIRVAAEQLASPPQDESRGEGVLDALFEATNWFQPSQPGDSIFVMALRLEGNHNVGLSTVRAAVRARRLRVFSFQLGRAGSDSPEPQSSYDPVLKYSSTLSTWQVFAGARTLSKLSGGQTFLEDTERKQYSLTDDRLKELRYYGGQMYKAVTEYYVLALESTGRDLIIGLAPPIQSMYPFGFLFYPRDLPPCSSITAATPAQAETTK